MNKTFLVEKAYKTCWAVYAYGFIIFVLIVKLNILCEFLLSFVSPFSKSYSAGQKAPKEQNITITFNIVMLKFGHMCAVFIPPNYSYKIIIDVLGKFCNNTFKYKVCIKRCIWILLNNESVVDYNIIQFVKGLYIL